MIYSMTGYAARTLDVERGALHIELKSVNSRYLDFQFRVCEELRSVELALRELFSTRLTRGKLECRVSFSTATARAQHAPASRFWHKTLNARFSALQHSQCVVEGTPCQLYRFQQPAAVAAP